MFEIATNAFGNFNEIPEKVNNDFIKSQRCKKLANIILQTGFPFILTAIIKKQKTKSMSNLMELLFDTAVKYGEPNYKFNLTNKTQPEECFVYNDYYFVFIYGNETKHVIFSNGVYIWND